MISLGEKKKNIVFLPETIKNGNFIGKLYGTYDGETGVFNVFDEHMLKSLEDHSELGEIFSVNPIQGVGNGKLTGLWKDGSLSFTFKGQELEIKEYRLLQNIFSRNTGILESSTMKEKCSFILGCGSVGSLVALELARAGVGKFVLIDNDIIEYHNICRHQCSIYDVGSYKVRALEKRIKAINPTAIVEAVPRIVEETNQDIFDAYCKPNEAVLVGCADNRYADVYANSIAINYGVPFVSIGFWERAFAGEIFYYLPNMNYPCYKCALGDGGGFSQRPSVNRRIYTTEEDLNKVVFEPGISVDISFVTGIGIKLLLDILNYDNGEHTPRLLGHLQQYTLVCNTNNPKIGGEMAEIFSYPLQVTTSLKVNFCGACPPCIFECNDQYRKTDVEKTESG